MKLHASKAEGVGLTPGQGAKVPLSVGRNIFLKNSYIKTQILYKEKKRKDSLLTLKESL